MEEQSLQEQSSSSEMVVLRALRPITVEEATQIEAEMEDRLFEKLGRPVPVLVLGMDFEVTNLPGRLAAIEAKLDALVEVLSETEDEEDQMQLTLDGEPAGVERDQSRSLD
jgi:hypothetical protein